MTPHPLDRPVWSALTGRQNAIASGSAAAWRIDPAMGLFAGAADIRDAAALIPLLHGDAPIWTVEREAISAPPGLTAQATPCVQMIVERTLPPRTSRPIVALGDADATEMIALATLTRPGPFIARTHRYGGFIGIRVDGRLVAMAGTRLRPAGHTEVSGVCTHPDHRGHGHAAALIAAVVQSILATGDRAFLHTYADNHGAIALYRRLGFKIRCENVMTALLRSPPPPSPREPG